MSKTLAIFGGSKTIDVNRKHFVWPPITETTRRIVLKQMDKSISIYNRSGIIEKLETAFVKYHNRKYALLTNSGTSALHSLFVGANLEPGNEILCPAYTFYATITPIFFTGAVPVLVDCREDGNIDPDKIENHITNNTKAIIVTHMWGRPCEMDKISAIADAYDLILLEDASHAHGALYKEKKVGSFGHASAFSLQGQKTVTGGEGGILLTDCHDTFYRALLLGHYNKRCKIEIPPDHPLYKFATTGMGLKLRIHPIAAAIAHEQFLNLEMVLAGRQRIAKIIMKGLRDLPGLKMPSSDNDIEHAWYAFIIQYDSSKLDGLPIDRFYEALLAEGCTELDRPGSTCPLNYHPLFQDPTELFPAYKGKVSYGKGDFPIAEKFHENSLKLPVWHDSTNEDIVKSYITAFRKVVDNYKSLL